MHISTKQAVRSCIKVPSACNMWNKRQKGQINNRKLIWSGHSRINQSTSNMLYFSGNTGINDFGFLLLPSHHPISPATPGGLVWWQLSQETWPAPSAPVYLSMNLPLGQLGCSLAGFVIQQQSKGGSRWRWCGGFSSSRAPLDFLNLQREDKVTFKKWYRVNVWTVWESARHAETLTLIHPVEDCF